MCSDIKYLQNSLSNKGVELELKEPQFHLECLSHMNYNLDALFLWEAPFLKTVLSIKLDLTVNTKAPKHRFEVPFPIISLYFFILHWEFCKEKVCTTSNYYMS